MIDRYILAEFAELWSDANRFKTWLEIELAACQVMETVGLVPQGVSSRLHAKQIVINSGRIKEIEKTTKHDVIAFLTHIEEFAGEDARWLHRGMTSSDVTDSALSILMRDAANLLIKHSDNLLAALAKRAREHAKTSMIGRSHGISAEPVTFGLVLAGHHAEVNRAKARLITARDEISVGKLSGAVGTYAHLSPEIERIMLKSLGLKAETVSTQIIARDRHAVFFTSLALMATAIERLATNIRHWQRSEVGEAEEAFMVGQKGSSAMPHKRNPIMSENLCGLARIVRSAVTPAFENVVLWHERDISHSSVERILAPDTTSVLGFMLDRATKLIDGLVIYADNMFRNLYKSNELYCSEAVLLALVNAGMARQDAYVLVQRNAMSTWNGNGRFRDNLANDSDIMSKLSKDSLAKCFNIEHALAWVSEIIDRALTEM